uniref:Uncharacterized protein n=1 Tax=Arundo donax TaxID=35708 RepID=A0A0A9BGP5_ARUDO
MAMTPPAAASLLHRILLPGAAAGPLFRLAPRSPASVSVALLPRRRRWRGPVQLQSLPPEGASCGGSCARQVVSWLVGFGA